MPAKISTKQIRFLGSALLWGMVEFMALRRARRQDGRLVPAPTTRRGWLPLSRHPGR